MSVQFGNMIGEAGPKVNGVIIDIEKPINKHTGDQWSSYFTVIPISSWEYRSAYPTKAKFQVSKLTKTTLITVVDDYGTGYSIVIDNDDPALQKVLNYFKEEHIPESSGGLNETWNLLLQNNAC